MDPEESSKKRSYRSPQDSSSSTEKRPRQQDTPSSVVGAPSNDAQAESVPSIQDMIAIPLHFVFRQVPPTHLAAAAAAQQSQQQRSNKPLLSRAEAQCFLSIGMLANEMDSLTELSAKALEQQHSYLTFEQKLERTNNPFLRPVRILAAVLGQHVPSTTLSRIQSELETITAELRLESTSLRQFSEQNWILSESLMDAMSGTSGEIVAKEKRRLSDVQEEVCNRIDNLLRATVSSSGNEECDLFEGSIPTLEEYVAQKLNEEALSPPAPSAGLPLSSSQQGSQQSSVASARSSSSKKQPFTEHKENTPSQQQQLVVVEEVYPPANQNSAASLESPACTQNAAEVLSMLGRTEAAPGESSEA